MSNRTILTGDAPLSGSDEEKARNEAFTAWHQKLGEDLVKALNAHTKEHGSDNVPNLKPVDPAELAAALEADKSC
jgi:hypothetical protein